MKSIAFRRLMQKQYSYRAFIQNISTLFNTIRKVQNGLPIIKQ